MQSLKPTPVFGFGQTRHARHWPAVNAFAVGTAFIRLPMRTLMAQAPQRIGGLFGINQWAAIGFRDRDHGERNADHGSALAWVDGLLNQNGIQDATGEIWLHTFPCVLSYAFKPVSFWFCHAPSGELRAVLAEVHNTFGEQHCYLLRHASGASLRDGETIHATKAFHVSPFFPVRGEYAFRWLVRDAQSVLRIDYCDAQHKPTAPDDITLSTSISGKHHAISVVSCLRACVAYPAQAFSVVARIHWQALKLWVKRVKFYPSPPAPKHAVSVSITSKKNHSNFKILQMNSDALNSHSPIKHDTPPPRAANFMFRMLNKLEHGALTVHLPDGSVRSFGNPHDDWAAAELYIHDWRLFAIVLRGGDIAFAECFMDGQFTTPHLPNLLKIMVANRSAIESALYGTWWGSLIDRALHLFRRNSKAQSRKNIAAHYDLGNPFYKLWLDPSMTYSAALFDNAYHANPSADDALLAQAQAAKYQRVIDALSVPSQGQILEIGCGWGGFASAAAQAGHQIKGLTLSREQLAYANERLKAEGVAGQVTLCLQDYRDEGLTHPAQYDGIASIEMFEAVGESYWSSYFECVARNLKAGGKACIQTIVIRDGLFERYRKGTDFIQRYIFPGGMLPSPGVFVQAAQKAGLNVVNQHAFGLDYARTLAVWRLRFLNELTAVKAQGYPDKFIRMWEFYLAYCEAGFVGGDIDVVQFTLQKP